MDDRITSDYEKYRDGLFQIMDFYVLNTPVPKTSRRGKSFADIGWRGGKVNTLQALMRGSSSLGDRWICDKQSSLQAHLDRIASEGGSAREYAVYAKGGSKQRNDTKTSALFYGIRCALAHGGFRVFEEGGDRWYELENFYRGNVRGHFMLREKTLLKWKEILEAGPDSGSGKRKRGKGRR